MRRVEGKIAIVTGAASGIGRSSATALAAEGAIVVATDIDEAAGRQVVTTIEKAGGQAVFYRQDVTSEAEWIAMAAEIDARYGRLNVLVNNAGISVIGLVTELTLEGWKLQQAVNVESVFLGVKHLLPLIRKSGGGSIINLSSVAGLRGSAEASAYCASKGAVRLFTKAVALECAAARDNVRVNSIHPGVIDTPIWTKTTASVATQNHRPGANAPDMDAIAEMMVPTGRKGLPEDIAAGVVFLASDESRYVNGSELVIDGALSAR